MRQLIAVAVVILVSGATHAIGATPNSDVFIKGRLLDLERAPGCGWILFGSPATYEVITGPDELVGREIHVLIDCVEMPRGGTAADHGDLKAFEVGEIHYLALTKENIHGIEVPNTLPTDAIWFYLRAASLDDLRPEAEALVSNLAKWSNHGIKGYSFRLHFTGHVPVVGPLPAARVRVRSGVVVDARLLGALGRLPAGSQAPQDPYVARFLRMTVEELFAKAADSIEYARARPGATLHITYDPKFGFPDKIDVKDPDTSDADGEYLVDEFEVSK